MPTEIRKGEVVCSNCGAEIRENTAFCFKCGVPVQDESPVEPDAAGLAEPPMSENARAALDDLEQRLNQDTLSENLAKAAAKRRKARVTQLRPRPAAWQPTEGGPGILFIVVTLLVLIVAAMAVYFTAISK